MATENTDHVRLARDVYDAISRNDLGPLSTLLAEDVKMTAVPNNQTIEGRENVINYVRGFKQAFPDLNLSVQRQVANDDTVISEFIATGTHQGPFVSPLGEIPPTGRHVEMPVCEIVEFKNGKQKHIRQFWNVADLLGKLGALGPGSEQRIH